MGRRYQQRSTIKKENFNRDQGFTLVEILVALVLVTIVFLSLPISNTNNGRKALERTIDHFDRAVRFAQNEAILRNTVTRIKINFEKRPQEYKVQYGPAQKIKIPGFEDIEEMSLSEREIYEAKMEKFNRRFATVSEFKDQPNTPEGEVIILGVGTNLYPNIVREGIVSVFFYPSGERDDTIFILSSDSEMATLRVQSFNERTTDEYIQVLGEEDMDEDQFSDAIDTKVKELYEQWSK